MEGGLPHTLKDTTITLPHPLVSGWRPILNLWFGRSPPLRHGESAERILITCSESGHDPPPDFASARAAARAMASQRFWTARSP